MTRETRRALVERALGGAELPFEPLRLEKAGFVESLHGVEHHVHGELASVLARNFLGDSTGRLPPIEARHDRHEHRWNLH